MTLSLRSALGTAGLPGDLPDVPVKEAPGWFRRMWARGIVAVTLPWAVYLSPESYAAIAEGRDRRLLAHEAAHVEQWHRLGVLGFSGRYLGDYLRGRLIGLPHHVAYRAIRLEREAEEFAWQAIEQA